MGDRQEEGIQVLLNVYDVTSTPGDPKSTTVRLNRITRELGLGGVFHGAIQLATPAQLGSSEPVEFSFGWCERGTGVYAVRACQNPMYQYRETICLGSTPKTLEEVRAIIQDAKAAWPGSSYDLLLRNCCHFCEQLAGQLEVGPVPGWLNRFAVGAAATVSMTQETVKTVQEIGQELGRLSGESLSFLKASWQKTLAAASQQQQPLSERLQRQRELQGVAGSTASAAAAGGRSAPDMHAPAGLEAEAWGEQHPHLRSASEACIAGARSSSSSSSNSSISGAAAAWPPGAGAAAAASAGQSLLSGFQQGGRQLKALTSRLGARLMQQQQQHNPAADASLQDAAAAGQSQAPSAWQQQQQQPEYAGMSPGDYLQPRAAGQQAWQQPPVQQQEEQQQQQPSGSRLVPAVQPKLAPQFCVDGPDTAADPLASLLLDDAESPAARGSSGSSIGGAAGGSGQGQAQQAAAQHAQHSDLLS